MLYLSKYSREDLTCAGAAKLISVPDPATDRCLINNLWLHSALTKVSNSTGINECELGLSPFSFYILKNFYFCLKWALAVQESYTQISAVFMYSVFEGVMECFPRICVAPQWARIQAVCNTAIIITPWQGAVP